MDDQMPNNQPTNQQTPNDEAASTAALPEITERQEMILSLIVREYIQAAQPVGSKTLVEQFDLGVSSATVRNDMGVLEQEGLIYAPHTSAGRVPTRLGYRYFVHRLLKTVRLSARERASITKAFERAPHNVEDWPRIAAVALSQTARTAALATPPRPVDDRFKHLELISTQGRLVLMVLVMQGGSVNQQMLTLAEPVPQTVLSQTAQIINAECAGLTADDVRARLRSQTSDELLRDIGELVADAMILSQHQTARDVVRYGLSESLASFNDDEAQQALRVLEEEDVLEDILRELFTADEPDVHIVVAGEGRWESVNHLSMILGRYGTPHARGALGVLGPTRMRYGRAVSTVRYVANLMSGLLGEVHGEGKHD